MRKIELMLVLLVLLMFSLSSCKTVEPEKVVETRLEYITVPVDISASAAMVLDTRPSSDFEIVEEPANVLDILSNGVAYQTAWERWQSYAFRLEDYIESVKRQLLAIE